MGKEEEGITGARHYTKERVSMQLSEQKRKTKEQRWNAGNKLK
jgi:hypothetical protein